MNVDTTQELKHLSLCTGYGGIDLGLTRALGALRSVAYVEIEAFAVSNLVAKIENGHLDAAPVFSNLKTFSFSSFRGSVDIVSGGFPCQPFSAAGRRAGDEDPRHLWPHIVRGIRELGRPPIVFFENVEGIISSKLKSDEWSDPEGTPVLLHVLRELERLGYEATAGVFSAREVGAPHQRKRVFILGCRSDLGESGRALVSGMLERWGGAVERMGDSDARMRESAERRSAERSRGSVPITESSTAYPAPRGEDVEHTRSNSGRCTRTSLHSERGAVEGRRASVPSKRTTSDTHAQYASIGAAYPAPRGETVGDAKHARPSRTKERGGFEKTSDNHTERSNSTSKLERTNQSDGSGNLQTKSSTAYPAPRGTEQYTWEPPRVTVGDARSREQEPPELESGFCNKPDREGETGKSQRSNDTRRASPDTREAQPPMGGNADGSTCGLGYAELCYSVDNRTDELRLLGNGVVPDTAARAFRELWEDIR